MNDEQATKLAREAALAWRMSTDEKTEHTYSEVLHGLAALLVSVGFVYVPTGKGGWIDTVAGLLSTMFHWPLASYNIWQMTAEQIVRGVCQAYTPRSVDREAIHDRHWSGPRQYYNDSIAEKCADFDQYAREVRKALETKGIKRRGTQKWKAFYSEKRDHAIMTMENQVNIGIVAVEREYMQKADAIRSEYLPDIERDLSHRVQQESVLRKLCEAVDKPFPEALESWFAECRKEYERRRNVVESHCTWLVKQCQTEDVTALVQEVCKRRPELAPFFAEEETKP
jgi:hypothetical protein